jgi:hypothetical protein
LQLLQQLPVGRAHAATLSAEAAAVHLLLLMASVCVHARSVLHLPAAGLLLLATMPLLLLLLLLLLL